MPVVEIPCPKCRTKLKAPDDAAGKKVKCGKCGTKFRIPGEIKSDSAGEPQALSVVAPAPVPADDKTEIMSAEPVNPRASGKDLSTLPSADAFDFGKPPKPAFGTGKPPAPSAAPSKPASTPSKPGLPKKPASTPSKPGLPAGKPAPLSLDDAPPAAAPPASSFAFSDAPAKDKKRRDEDDEEPPPKKRKREDDDEDEPRSKRRRRDEEDDDEPPRKKRKRKDDEEGADEPRAKKTRRDEDEDEDERPAKSKQASASNEGAAEPYNPFANLDPGPEPPPGKIKKKPKRREDDDDDDDEDDEPRARKKRRDDEDDDDKPRAKKRRRDDEEEEEFEKPRYQRPKEKAGMGMALILTAVIGVVALGLGVTAVIVYVSSRKPPETTQPENQDENPPASPGGDPGTPAEPNPKDKEPEPKPKEKEPEPKPKGKEPAPGSGLTRPAITYRNLRTFAVGALPPKTELADKPRGGMVLESPLANVRRVFPPFDPKVADTYVLVQAAAPAGEKGEKLALETYTQNGNRLPDGRIEYPGDGLANPIADVFSSPDGAFFLAAVGGKLHVWNIIEKKKIADGIEPYATKPEHAKSGLAAAFFTADPNHVVLVSTAGAVLKYDLKAGKPLSEFIPPDGLPGKVALGDSIAKGGAGGSVAVAVAGRVYQIDTTGDLNVVARHDLGGDVGRSLGLAVSAESPGRMLYTFETADGKKDAVVAAWPLESDKPTLFRFPAGAGEPKRALWTGGDTGGIATDRGVVWFDDHENKFVPHVMTQPTGPGQFYADSEFFWFVVPHPKEADKSALAGLKLPFDDVGAYEKNYPANRPLRVVKIDATGLSK